MLLSVSLVKDLNTQPALHPSAYSVGGVDDSILFNAFDPATGNELWRADSAGHASLVKDLAPGPTSSNPQALVRCGSTAFFSTVDAVGGLQLWKTDGTTAGTVPLKTLSPDGGIGRELCVGNVLYFTDIRPASDTSVWRSDGTPQGTVMLHDFGTGILQGGMGVLSLDAVGDSVLFFVRAGGQALWKTDGTVAGTTMLAQFNNGTLTGPWVGVAAGKLFLGLGGLNGASLWASDGAAAGTMDLKDFNQPTAQVVPMGELNGREIFQVTGEPGLWSSDGTAAGTQRFADIPAGSQTFATQSGGELYFTLGLNGLWKTNGTAEGTSHVADLPRTIYSDSLTALGGGVAFYAAGDVSHGVSLWKSDGTTDGTTQITEFLQRPNIYPSPLFAIAGRLYFYFPGDSGQALWSSDGTAEATKIIRQDPTVTADFQLAQVASPVVIGNVVFFLGDDGSGALGLFRSDGSADGTTLLYPFEPGVYVVALAASSTTLYFQFPRGQQVELWRSDGTIAGTSKVMDLPGTTVSVLAGSAAIGQTVLFDLPVANGEQLWKTDGTAAGTVPISDVFVAQQISNITAAGQRVFFAVAGLNLGSPMLWTSDGTPSGTVQLANVGGHDFAALNGALFFASYPGGRVWRSDGTPAGTLPIAEFSSIFQMLPAGDRLYLNVIDNFGRPAIYAGDGGDSIVPVADFPNTDSSFSVSLAAPLPNGVLLFVVHDHQNYTLWRSDGTHAGTLPVAELHGYPNLGTLTRPPVVNGVYYFSVNSDPSIGSELYRTDGTPAGTYLVKDINPGQDSSLPQSLTPAGDRLFFVANDGLHGRELWVLDSLPDSISGRIFNDLNHDGADENEPGLAGVTVYLDANNNGVLDPGEISTRTDSNGTYSFAHLAPGTYAVRQVLPGGYGRTTSIALAPVTVVGETTAARPVFGDALLSSVNLDFNYLLVLARHYGSSGTLASGDLNGDDIVNFADLLILGQNYGKPAPPSVACADPPPADPLMQSVYTSAIPKGKRRPSRITPWLAEQESLV